MFIDGVSELRKLNLAHLITKLELGGAQLSTLDLITAIDPYRYNKILISANNGPLVKEASQIPGVKTEFLPTLKRRADPLNDLRTLFRLRRLLKAKEIDIIHTHSSKAGILGRWAAWLAGTPIIIHTFHGFSFHNFQSYPLKKLYIFLERLTAKITTRLIAVSQPTLQKGLDAGIGKPEGYSVLHYGIRLHRFFNCRIDIKKMRAQLGAAPDSPLVGMISCLKPQKSPLDYVRAVHIVSRQFPSSKFLLVGDGVLRPKVERLIARLNLNENLLLLGWRRDIPEIMRSLDILVLTSKWEGLPIVFLEAMASSKPIVATDVDGAREIIKEGHNGYLVLPGDYQRLAQRIAHLLKEPGLAHRMGQNGRNMLGSSFQLESMVQGLEEVYEDLVNSHPIN